MRNVQLTDKEIALADGANETTAALKEASSAGAVSEKPIRIVGATLMLTEASYEDIAQFIDSLAHNSDSSDNASASAQLAQKVSKAR